MLCMDNCGPHSVAGFRRNNHLQIAYLPPKSTSMYYPNGTGDNFYGQATVLVPSYSWKPFTLDLTFGK